jgi:hypothetical protein
MEWRRRQDHRLGSVKMKEDQEYTEMSRGAFWFDRAQQRSLSKEYMEIEAQPAAAA